MFFNSLSLKNSVVNQVMFHYDGNTVISASADKTIKLWDVRSHQLIQHYSAHADSVNSISLHPSGNYLLSSSKDSSLKIWDLREGRLLFTLQGHQGPVNDAAFTIDGHFFASGGSDQLVMVWKSNLNESNDLPKVEWSQESNQSANINTQSNTSNIIPPSPSIKSPINQRVPSQINPIGSHLNNRPSMIDRIITQPLVIVRNERNISNSPKRPLTSTSSNRKSKEETIPSPRRLLPQPINKINNITTNDQIPQALIGTLDHIMGQVSYN